MFDNQINNHSKKMENGYREKSIEKINVYK